MSIEKIHQALTQKFEETRIVFWYDDSREFEAALPRLSIDNVEVINLSEVGSFEAKYTLEVLKPTSKFLLYSPTLKPENAEDILLDVYLYSTHFSADSAEIIRDELKLQDLGTREFIKSRLSYFSSSARNSSLAPLLDGTEDENALALRMIQVLLGARGCSASELLLTLYDVAYKQDTYEPKEFLELEGFNLDSKFWNKVNEELGYSSDKKNLQSLLYALIATEIALELGADTPPALRPFAITAQHKANHCKVFMGTWRDSQTFQESYVSHIGKAEQELKLQELLTNVSSSHLIRLHTTEAIERILLTRSRELLTSDSAKKELEEVDSIISNRKNSYWSLYKEQYSSAYQAMNAALGLIKLKDDYPNGFHAFDTKSFIDLYTKDLLKFDERYRHYHQFLAANDVAGTLSNLSERVEGIYTGWYLPTLAAAWKPFVEGSLLQNWEIPGITNQKDFYSKVVKPLLNSKQNPRVAVIISDALRYEVARQLTSQINKRDNTQADISPLLSVLPSHTALGMAALLPHASIDYDQNANVVVDGKNSQGISNREQILQSVGGIAFLAADIKRKPREELRAKIGDSSLVYIYHNRIDDTGDKASSEKETFTAASESLTELDSIIGKVLNSLNCSIVIVTADHGFIFTHGDLMETDRSELTILSGDPIIEKKRFVVGANLQTNDKCWRSNSTITAGTTSSYDILVPRGVNRFHFKGGARYFHGGAMPQEIIVPAVTCKKKRDKAAEVTKTDKVDVILLNQISNITSPRQSLKFIQTAFTSEKLLPRAVHIGFYDESFKQVSDVHKLLFDASSESPGMREQSVTFAFKAIKFDSTKDYYLIIKEQGSDIELTRVAVRIKILIADEFI